MDYYAKIKARGYDFISLKFSHATRIYLAISRNGELQKVPILGQKTGGKGKQLYYFAECSNGQGAEIELQRCKLYSGAYKALRELHQGIDDLVENNHKHVDALEKDLRGRYLP
ncbi:hypothetical protein K5D50_10665 [Pseudomonas cichorii]|nr:hypothetical protein [Pseudomonas cichorii]